MPISPMNFQPMTFEQANPLLTGFGQATNIYGNLLANQKACIQNKYLPQSLEQQNYAQDLANQLSAAKLPYAAPMEEAELGLKQAQVPLINAQTGEANARIPLYGAQTNLTNQQAKFLPLEDLIKAQGSLQQSSRFGGAYQLAKSLSEMPPAARDAWIAQNQTAYNQNLADLGNQQMNPANLLNSSVLSRFFPEMNQSAQSQGGQPTINPPGTQSLPVSPQQQQNVQSMTAGLPLTVPTQPGQRFSSPTQDQIEQVRQASQMEANNRLTTQATRRQMEGALQVENIFNSPYFQNQVQNASEYAGAFGKGKAALSALSQQNPKAYEDYLSLQNQTMPLLANRIKTLDQMGATDKQREDLNGLYTKTANSLTSNPKQFVTQMNQLGKMLDTVAQSVQKSATPLFATNRLSPINEIPMPGQGVSQNNMQQQQPPAAGNLTAVLMPDGVTWHLPKEKVSTALQRGGRIQ